MKSQERGLPGRQTILIYHDNLIVNIKTIAVQVAYLLASMYWSAVSVAM